MRSPIDDADTSADTIVRPRPDVHAPDPSEETTEQEDDATLAMHRSALKGPRVNVPPPAPSLRRGRFEESAGPQPLSARDVHMRPIDSAGFEQRYEARSVLGVGGMGEVRLCKDRLIGRDVALKVIRITGSAAAEARERFVREARIQGQLEHPSIVPVYDLGVDPAGNVYFTMKRILGMTIDAVVYELKMGDEEATAKYTRRRLLTAFGQACLAVDFAHKRGVLHRDLKPGNIIVGDFGEVYVLDWGLAKIAGAMDGRSDDDALELTVDSLSHTMHGSLLGTPGYMSPEQARGEIDLLDARADVYALGAILFELLTLEPLHKPGSVETVLLSTLRGADARPSSRAGVDVPPELEAICVRATALDPAQRYASARELSDAIDRFLDGDRNVQVRRDLAASHVAAARSLLARGTGTANARQARTEALREVGSALALDPTNAEALGTMAKLLVEVPDEVPREAEAELDAAAGASRAAAARTLANRFLGWLVSLVLALWMGIRHWPITLFTIGVMLATGVIGLWMARKNSIGLRHGAVLLGLSSLIIGLMSALFGPFILVPGQAATTTMLFAMNTDKRLRPLVITVGALTVALPFFLEWTGVVPPAYSFQGGLFQVIPRATELPALQTMICLLLTSVAMVIVPGLLVGRMRDALTTAERRLFLQAWQLRQLVPDEARQAMAAQRSGPKR